MSFTLFVDVFGELRSFDSNWWSTDVALCDWEEEWSALRSLDKWPSSVLRPILSYCDVSCLRKSSLSVGSLNVAEFFWWTFALCFFRPPFLSDILFKNWEINWKFRIWKAYSAYWGNSLFTVNIDSLCISCVSKISFLRRCVLYWSFEFHDYWHWCRCEYASLLCSNELMNITVVLNLKIDENIFLLDRPFHFVDVFDV